MAACELQKQLRRKLNLGATASASAATAAKLGDFFQYAIDKPVSLPRQKSALLPIVNKDVEGTRVSIYNERTQAKFPLLGLKFKNTSGLHLMQGPITVFEGSNYAGDARILDLQPNEERLHLLRHRSRHRSQSGAVDATTAASPGQGGQGHHPHDHQDCARPRPTPSRTATTQERLVLIEHPVRNDFKLVDDKVKPTETASDFYRFEVKVPAGKTETQVVTEERIINSNMQLTNTTTTRSASSSTTRSPATRSRTGLQERAGACAGRWPRRSARSRSSSGS